MLIHTSDGLQTLVTNAYAQQADRDRIVYARINGDDVLIMMARLREAAR